MAVLMDTGVEGKAAQRAAIRARMRQIEQVIAGLNGISTKVEDVLGGDASIKNSYHLAGKKYETLTTAEDDIRTVAQTAFNKQKESVIGDLQVKYRELQMEEQSLL